MKSTFSGFYSTSGAELRDIWNSDATLFVFDTNCLLNLYRCEDHTRADIVNVMKEISKRIWLPFQVGFEYQRNRRAVIEESIISLIKIKDELKDTYSRNILESGNLKKNLYSSLSDEISELKAQIKTPIDEYIEKKITPRIKSKQSISDHDFIRDAIDEIIGDKIGKTPTQETINRINVEGDERYKKKIPPGFKDEKKGTISYFSGIELTDKFGDLYLWKQLIEKAADANIENVIFICDDNKSDWWYNLSGRTHGALASLKTEICNNAGIREFKLINQLTFLHEAKEYLVNVDISDSSLKEVEELSLIRSFDNIKNQLKTINENNKISSEYYSDQTTTINYHKSNLSDDNLYIKHDADIIFDSAQKTLDEFEVISKISKRNIEQLKYYKPELCKLLGDEEYLKIKNPLTANHSIALIHSSSLKYNMKNIDNNIEEILTKIVNCENKLAVKISRLHVLNEIAENYLEEML